MLFRSLIFRNRHACANTRCVAVTFSRVAKPKDQLFQLSCRALRFDIPQRVRVVSFAHLDTKSIACLHAERRSVTSGCLLHYIKSRRSPPNDDIRHHHHHQHRHHHHPRKEAQVETLPTGAQTSPRKRCASKSSVDIASLEHAEQVDVGSAPS